MSDREPDPFEDVEPLPGGFSLPELKWRELLFVGALRAQGDGFVRDTARPLPPFRIPHLFPEGCRFRAERHGGRVHLRIASGLQASDPQVARRLEAAEVDGARAACQVEPGAALLEVAGGVATWCGAGSPLTHALGLGMSGPVSNADLDAVESFYALRASGVEIVVCPLADGSLLERTAERGYQLTSLEHALARALAPEPVRPRPDPTITIERLGPDQRDEWSDLVGRGFSGCEDEPSQDLSTGRILFQSSHAYWARSSGQLAGAAAAGYWQGVASFFADATLGSCRGRGIQAALIDHRLGEAARAGCTLAMASVVPGSPSHRNYERAGFEVIYTKAVLRRRA